MDRLSTVLAHFSLHAGVFHTGAICGVHAFEHDARRGHLHLIRRGRVEMIGMAPEPLVIAEPTLIFLPRPERHRLITRGDREADVVCGTIQFGESGRNPVTDSMPAVISVPIAALPAAEALLDLMFAEAFGDLPGAQAVLDRLCEVLIIHLLRHCIAKGLTRGGTLAGLADPRLGRVVAAIHDDPAAAWDLPAMAGLAGMSRARFAVHFRTITGQTPFDYLASWRVMLAQQLLARGLQLKHVAYDVGYGSSSALARAFARKLGCTPPEWLRQLHEDSRVAANETLGSANETRDDLKMVGPDSIV